MTVLETKRFSQLRSSESRPGLRPIALLRLSPRDLERALHLEFEEQEDDLDRYQVALLRMPGGGEFALFRYRQSPSGGTEIWTKSSPKKMRSDLSRALEALGLTLKKVSWTHPELPKQPVRSVSKPTLVERSGRVGRNPATGEKIRIPAKRVVQFRGKAATVPHGNRRRPAGSAKKK